MLETEQVSWNDMLDTPKKEANEIFQTLDCQPDVTFHPTYVNTYVVSLCIYQNCAERWIRIETSKIRCVSYMYQCGSTPLLCQCRPISLLYQCGSIPLVYLCGYIAVYQLIERDMNG